MPATIPIHSLKACGLIQGTPLNEAVLGKNRVSDSIVIGPTPNIFHVCGAEKGLDFTISKTVIDKCMRPEIRNMEGRLEGKTGHGLTEEQLYSALMNVKEPVMVLKGNRENSFVVITEYPDNKNRSIVVSVVLDKQSGRTMINDVSSVYGRDNFEEYIQRQMQEDKILAIDNKKAERLLQPIGKWYPKRGKVINYDATIAYTLENVKYPEKEDNADQSEVKEDTLPAFEERMKEQNKIVDAAPFKAVYEDDVENGKIYTAHAAYTCEVEVPAEEAAPTYVVQATAYYQKPDVPFFAYVGLGVFVTLVIGVLYVMSRKQKNRKAGKNVDW